MLLCFCGFVLFVFGTIRVKALSVSLFGLNLGCLFFANPCFLHQAIYDREAFYRAIAAPAEGGEGTAAAAVGGREAESWVQKFQVRTLATPFPVCKQGFCCRSLRQHVRLERRHFVRSELQ